MGICGWGLVAARRHVRFMLMVGGVVIGGVWTGLRRVTAKCLRRFDIELDHGLASEEAPLRGIKPRSNETDPWKTVVLATSHEDGFYVPGCQSQMHLAFWPSRELVSDQGTLPNPPYQSCRADNVVQSVRSWLTKDPRTTRDALILTRHVYVSSCPSHARRHQVQCTEERVVNSLIGIIEPIEVSKAVLIGMVDRL